MISGSVECGDQKTKEKNLSTESLKLIRKSSESRRHRSIDRSRLEPYTASTTEIHFIDRRRVDTVSEDSEPGDSSSPSELFCTWKPLLQN
ncbi:hypothetical protein M8J77_013489 [Diaphorina citri]|nr:hypothetical protein M8J77_013489 [Diaphorina citri]